ncbi:MAG: hypothetical protein AMDU2_EPLC00005G0143 [Thermoplasmatales archaeon E-plasma]|jgi:hypothetical protein|nr:MAG: hypothetical protein AMDU2_EPLC00005G0143 [Thermoplasmatales archaeon E-plasma]
MCVLFVNNSINKKGLKAIVLAALFVLSLMVVAVPSIAAQASNELHFGKVVSSSSGTTSSTNWAGYVAASSFSSPAHVVTSITGSWTVQSVSASSSSTYSSQWIGIGGFFSHDRTLIQTGTESDYSSGSAQYSAWYEMLPAAETPISGFTVSPGDVISSAIVYAGVAPHHSQYWNIYLNDTSQNEHFYIQVTYKSSMLSAEWIEERPEIGGQLSSLANFGTAYYGADYTSIAGTNYATINGVTEPLGALPYESITMTTSSGALYAQPSALTSDGTSFSVTYE